MLAERFPESADALLFYGAIALFQRDGAPGKLLELVAARGPELLGRLARELGAKDCRVAADAWASGEDRASPRSFFGRVLLQAQTEGMRGRCPACGDAPQVGCLIREGDGTALTLACAICFNERRHPKARCPACSSDELVHYHAPELDHLEVQACDGCRSYINVVRMNDAPDAVPDVDEIAALPLDVWASEKGYRKLVRNLVGI